MQQIKAFIVALVLMALAVWHARSEGQESVGRRDFVSMVIIASLVTLLTT